jgi:2-oxoglutarate dehydrogenase E2 component (dihydrolipoamide succinyltransferase)
MAFEVRVPQLGESVTEAVVARWAKQDGDAVALDDVLLELETDKATVEVAAERAGVLRIRRPEGATVEVGDLIAVIEEDGAAAKRSAGGRAGSAAPPAEPARAAPALSPAVRRLVEEHGVDPAAVTPTGPGGRLTKADVLAHVGEKAGDAARRAAPSAPATASAPRAVPAPKTPRARPAPDAGEREERVPMGRIRLRIAERLVAAQHTAAILTTFNEIDMSAVMALRSRHKEAFERKHGVRLGFMSFFAMACCRALEEIPAVNAEIQGEEVVYRRYVNLGIAVGTERGLVVPVVKDADRMTLADVEREVGRLAERARTGTLAVDELTGGTFTISNGGVYGSLMSTPILNPPQSGILGMHKIEKRPVVVGDEIVVRPMMYVALSYDHRLVDGEQAVTFLVRVKEQIEDPTRLVLGL